MHVCDRSENARVFMVAITLFKPVEPVALKRSTNFAPKVRGAYYSFQACKRIASCCQASRDSHKRAKAQASLGSKKQNKEKA